MDLSKSRIFLFFCLFFLGGVFISSLIKVSPIFCLAILASGVFFIFVWGALARLPERRIKIVVGGFCLLFLATGIYRFQQSGVAVGPPSLSRYNDQEPVSIKGSIVSEPEIKNSSTRLVVAGKIGEVAGKLLVMAPRYPEYRYGDQLEIKGRLRTPQNIDDFDYRNYLAKDEIYSIVYYPEIVLLAKGDGNVFYRSLYQFRQRFEEKINELLAEPQASFLNGLILGQKSQLPEELLDSFKKTGTTHLIALSGYNITIIASMLIWLFSFLALSRQQSFWLAVIGIVFFVIMVGASSSISRAAIMGILVLLARREGRLYSPTNSLILAGTVMVFLNPRILRFDLGFQLSFLATCGLFYLSPLLEKKLGEISDVGSFRTSLVTTLSAQIFVLPLLLSSFKNLSLISPLANILILPTIPLAMLLGFVTTVVGFIFTPLAQILAWPTWLFLSYQIRLLEFLAKFPWASVEFSFSWQWGIIYYLILLILLARFHKSSSEFKY